MAKEFSSVTEDPSHVLSGSNRQSRLWYGSPRLQFLPTQDTPRVSCPDISSFPALYRHPSRHHSMAGSLVG